MSATNLVRLWRPAVAATLVYAALFAALGFWMMRMSTDAPARFSDVVLTPRVASLSLFHLLSVVNVLWIAALIFDLRATRRADRTPLSPQLWGVVLAIVLMVGIQVATFGMRDAAASLAP